MSLKRVIEALITLGLSEKETQVYIYLATEGSKKSRNISENLKIKKQQLYPLLKKLQNMKIVQVKAHTPSIYGAVPFETVLDLLIHNKINQSEKILKNRNQLISYWKSVDWINDK